MGISGGQNNTSNSKLLGYRVQTSIQSKAIPIIFGVNRTSGNVIWTGDWKANPANGKAGKGKFGGTYDYRTAAIVALSLGPISALPAVWQSNIKNQASSVNYLNAVPASSLGLAEFNGTTGQSPWDYIASHHPDQALGYSGIAYVANPSWDLGSAGMFQNWSYEVAGLDVYPGQKDALVSSVIERLLFDPLMGVGFTSAEVDTAECQVYSLANSVFVSPILDSQRPAAEWIKQLLDVANCEAVWSEGVLKIRARGDTAASGNGATFTPNLTPVANLTLDDLKDREEPVRVSRPNVRDAYNAVSVNWTNRGNQYNSEPLQEMDQAAIDMYGFRPAASVDALGICLASVAAQCAQIQLKKNLYFRARYKFKLGWEHILLEPMDCVTLTVQIGTQFYQGLNNTLVRLLSIAEDEDGYLECEAEEMPQGAGNAVVHVQQQGGGYVQPSNAQPGSVTAPIFYEASYQMRQALYSTQYALLIALSGGSFWGGANVHRSFDGTNYEVVGRQVGVTPTGVLSADLPDPEDPDTTNTLSVNLLQSFGTLDSVTQADADNFKTLSVIGSGTATAELISYENATLTSPYNYNLTYLRRGVYGSTIAAFPAGTTYFLTKNAFVWIYQAQDIGKTVHFKLTSFNTAGNAEQGIGDTAVVDYTYTLTGGLSQVKKITADYTVQPADPALNADTTGGPITITLPDPTTVVNTTTVITNVGPGVVTIAGGGTGVGTATLTNQWQSITVEATPQGWIQIAGSVPKFVDDETPLGAVDGSNTAFSLAHSPSPSLSLALYRNGDLQGQGIDYTLSGANITFSEPPLPADWLRCWYRW